MCTSQNVNNLQLTLLMCDSIKVRCFDVAADARSLPVETVPRPHGNMQYLQLATQIPAPKIPTKFF